MGDLPIAPSIGDKRSRGDDDREEDAGNSLPPNLRGRTDRIEGSDQNNTNENTARATTQRWVTNPSTMPNPTNSGLDALYIGDLNWVGVDMYRYVVILTQTPVDYR